MQDAVLVLFRFPIGIVLVGSSVRGSPTWQRGEVSRGGPGRGAVVRAVGHVWGRPMLEGGVYRRCGIGGLCLWEVIVMMRFGGFGLGI